jgi:hypothetical protein
MIFAATATAAVTASAIDILASDISQDSDNKKEE